MVRQVVANIYCWIFGTSVHYLFGSHEGSQSRFSLRGDDCEVENLPMRNWAIRCWLRCVIVQSGIERIWNAAFFNPAPKRVTKLWIIGPCTCDCGVWLSNVNECAYVLREKDEEVSSASTAIDEGYWYWQFFGCFQTINQCVVIHLVTVVICSQGWWIQHSKETFCSSPNTTTNDDEGFCGLEHLALHTLTQPNEVTPELGHGKKWQEGRDRYVLWQGRYSKLGFFWPFHYVYATNI